MGYFIKRDGGQVVYRSWGATDHSNSRKMRVLVLKLDHVGDFWMALAPLKELRRRLSHAHITLVVGSWNLETAKYFAIADDYIAFDFFPRNPSLKKRCKEAASIKPLLTGEFDLAIDMRVPDETRPVLLAVPAKHRAAIVDRYRMDGIDIAIAPFNLKLRRTIFYKLAQAIGLANRIPRTWFDWFADRRQMRLQHVTEILFFLVAKAAAYFDNENGADHLRNATDKAGPIVVAPFSNSNLRDWPIDYFGQLVVALAERGDVIVVGRSENQPALEKVVGSAIDLGAARVRMAVNLSELDFNVLIKSAALVVSNNSGAGHVAAQLGRPTVGIFTASHLPEIWGFQGPLVSMLMSSIECRGCGLDQVRRCPIGVRCKFDIKPDQVLAEIDFMMGHLKRQLKNVLFLAASAIVSHPLQFGLPSAFWKLH